MGGRASGLGSTRPEMTCPAAMGQQHIINSGFSGLRRWFLATSEGSQLGDVRATPGGRTLP